MNTHTVESPVVFCGKMDVIIVPYTYSPWSGPACAINMLGRYIFVLEAKWDAFIKRVIYISC
jgi:hypothetical protein